MMDIRCLPFNFNGGVTDSTRNRSLSKRVAMWNCFKSHTLQLNGKATYGDKPNKKQPALRLISGGNKVLAAA